MKELAQGLASLGRGPDTMLIHMSPREVAGLQSLAMSAGGSLTINPNTGLVEAGFLDSLLPMLVGGVLGVMSGGLLIPALGGALTQGATTGDWSLGNLAMGGISGFGGAGLGSGIASAAQAAGQSAAQAGTAAAAQAGTTATQAGIDAAVQAAGGVGQAGAQNVAAQMGVAPLEEAIVSAKMVGPASLQTPQALMQGRMLNASGVPLAKVGSSPFAGYTPSGVAKGFGDTFSRAFSPGVDQKLGLADIQQGVKNVWGGMSGLEKAAVGMTGINALSSMDAGYGGGKYTPSDPMFYKTEFDPNSRTYSPGTWLKQNDFMRTMGYDPYYRDKKKKGRGGYAEGGDVEATSAPSSRDAAKQYYEGLLNPANRMPTTMAQYDPQANQAYLGGIRSLIAPKTSSNLSSMGIVPAGTGNQTPTGGTTPTGPNSGVLNPFGGINWANILGGGFGSLGTLGGLTQMNRTGTGGISNTVYNPATQTYGPRTTVPTLPTTTTSPTTSVTTPTNPMDYFGGMNNYYDQILSGNKYNLTGLRMAAGGAVPTNEYAAGGKLLRGPGDGMSDDIKANIEGTQEARLADGEFVMPADVVSHFGNGSTEAGAKHLYKVMDQIRAARTGNPEQGKQINPDKFLKA